MREILFSVLCIFIFCSNGLSHGDLDQRIIAATLEIEETPDNAELYFKRGKLYYQHQEYKNSVVDLNTAEYKGLKKAELYLLICKSYFELNDLENAEVSLRKFYNIDNTHIVAHKLEAKIELAKGNPHKSALQFEFVVKNAKVPLPENYIDAASSWLATNTLDGLDNAVTILKQGLIDIGPLYTLNVKIIDSYVKYELYSDAISHLESTIPSRKRKETSYYKLYELYQMQGDHYAANLSLEKALVALNKLPKRVKKNSAMIALRKKIQDNLTRQSKISGQ